MKCLKCDQNAVIGLYCLAHLTKPDETSYLQSPVRSPEAGHVDLNALLNQAGRLPAGVGEALRGLGRKRRDHDE